LVARRRRRITQASRCDKAERHLAATALPVKERIPNTVDRPVGTVLASGAVPAARSGLESLAHLVALAIELHRGTFAELGEERALVVEFLVRFGGIDVHKALERWLLEGESLPIDVLVARNIAEGVLHGARAAVNAVGDPGQNPHVLAVAGPDELAVLVPAEPV